MTQKALLHTLQGTKLLSSVEERGLTSGAFSRFLARQGVVERARARVACCGAVPRLATRPFCFVLVAKLPFSCMVEMLNVCLALSAAVQVDDAFERSLLCLSGPASSLSRMASCFANRPLSGIGGSYRHPSCVRH